jgi:hypothetical protein
MLRRCGPQETHGAYGHISMLRISSDTGSVGSALAAPNRPRRFASHAVDHGLVAPMTAFIVLEIRVLNLVHWNNRADIAY